MTTTGFLALFPKWTVYQSDAGVAKQQTIVDSSRNPRNLSGLAATLKVFKPGFNDASYIYLSVAINITDPLGGVVQWVPTSADLSALPVGEYSAQIVGTSAGYSEHTKPFAFYMRAGA